MRIDNPFDRVQMPISTPVSTPDGYLSRYNVPIDGKVTMFEFVHRTDDSPILIRQHYENWMAQAGFERLLICDSPCADAQWRKAIDPTSRLDVNYFPSKPTYIAGYKNNAMLVVGIGSMNWEHTSVLKVVEGKVLDPSVWEAVTKPKTVAPSVPLSRPAAQVQTPFIEDIAAGDINKTIASTKGILLLHLTSNDKGCGHCIQSNARFESLAAKSPASAKFARVAWRPWKSAFEDTFIKNHGINGVPTYLAYKDGILVKRINGNVPQTEVDGLLSAE